MSDTTPIDRGQGWLEPDGRRGRLTFFPGLGELRYQGWKFGAFTVGWFASIEEVDATIAGWQDHMEEGIQWVRMRCAPMSCPMCQGIGWVGSNFFEDSEVAVPCPICNHAAV